jgi:hypothetical protein
LHQPIKISDVELRISIMDISIPQINQARLICKPEYYSTAATLEDSTDFFSSRIIVIRFGD